MRTGVHTCHRLEFGLRVPVSKAVDRMRHAEAAMWYPVGRNDEQGAGLDGHAAFFVSRRGRLVVNTIDYTFADLVSTAGISAPIGERNPRVHDLRHSFAVRTLLEWYRAGLDVQSQLPVLSTWMGHISPASTYWYLQAAPELLAIAARRLEHPVPTTAQGALSWPHSRRFSKRSSPTI